MASATAARQQEASARLNRMSAPPTFATIGGATSSSIFAALPSTRRSKSIMLSRNLGTMRKAKEEKRKEAQADPNDDMILRILRISRHPSCIARQSMVPALATAVRLRQHTPMSSEAPTDVIYPLHHKIAHVKRLRADIDTVTKHNVALYERISTMEMSVLQLSLIHI